MTDANGATYSIRREISFLPTDESTFGPSAGGYGYGLTGEPPAPRRPQATVPPRASAPVPAKAEPGSGQVGLTPEIRGALRRAWKKAREAAEQMEQGSAGDDPMNLAIGADELAIALEDLWALRAARDIDWRTILNHAQGMLKQAFAEKRVEALSPDQCAAIRLLVERHLGTATKSADDLAAAVELIEKAGFDPYAAISADPVPDGGLETPRS